MPINVQYAQELHDQYGYLATWLPTAHIELGEYGPLNEGIFQRAGKLGDFSVPFVVETHPDAGDLAYASADAVSQEVKAAGNAPVTAGPGGSVDALVGISFSRANAILLQASHCTTSLISNMSQLSDAVLSLYAEGVWQKEWVVVTDLMRVEALTVLISSGANAEIDLSVKGDVGPSVAKLASANASYSIRKSSSIGTQIIGQRGATPLFKARGVKTSPLPWRGPVFQEKATDSQFDPVSIRDLLTTAPPDRAG